MSIQQLASNTNEYYWLS